LGLSLAMDVGGDRHSCRQKGCEARRNPFFEVFDFFVSFETGKQKKNVTQVKPKLSLAAHTMMSTGLLGLSAPLYLRHAFYNVVLVESP
jgi:hypothetical protein